MPMRFPTTGFISGGATKGLCPLPTPTATRKWHEKHGWTILRSRLETFMRCIVPALPQTRLRPTRGSFASCFPRRALTSYCSASGLMPTPLPFSLAILPLTSEIIGWVASTGAAGVKQRLTLTPPVINAAKQVLFLVAGADKAVPLHHVIDDPYLPNLYPAQIVARNAGDVLWYLDSLAAANL